MFYSFDRGNNEDHPNESLHVSAFILTMSPPQKLNGFTVSFHRSHCVFMSIEVSLRICIKRFCCLLNNCARWLGVFWSEYIWNGLCDWSVAHSRQLNWLIGAGDCQIKVWLETCLRRKWLLHLSENAGIMIIFVLTDSLHIINSQNTVKIQIRDWVLWKHTNRTKY